MPAERLTDSSAMDVAVRAFAASLPPSVSASIRCHIWAKSDRDPERERYSGVRWEMEGDECDTYGNASTVAEAIADMSEILELNHG